MTANPLVAKACRVCAGAVDLEVCVGCGQSICEEHRGVHRGKYLSHADRRGYACGPCIEAGLAYDGSGMVSSVREVKAWLHGVFRPAVMRDMNELVEASLQRVEARATALTRETVVEVEDAAGRLTRESLKELEASLDRMVGRLERAIAEQQRGPLNDAVAQLETAAARVSAKALATLDGSVDRAIARLETAVAQQTRPLVRDASENLERVLKRAAWWFAAAAAAAGTLIVVVSRFV